MDEKWVTYVEISTNEDNLALKVFLSQVTDALLGHGSDNSGALALQSRWRYGKIVIRW